MPPESRSSRSDAAPEPHSSEVVNELRHRFHMAAEPGLPKHSQLRKAVLACIESGLLRPGHKLPSEQVLTARLGLSLGTVRRALEQLAVGHVVVREHGHGTFVTEPPRPIDHNWHFRFLADDGKTLLPVLANQFGTTTIYVTQRARVEILSKRICAQIGAAKRTPGLFLQLTGHTFGHVPISYHEVWVPATPTMMDLAPVWATEPKN
jgi:DNA-binding GntR family transcriptional regulator